MKSSGTVVQALQRACASGTLHRDPQQLRVAGLLDQVRDRLSTGVALDSPGLYLHGGVGTGKSMLMDMLYSSCPGPKQRVHLGAFLLDVHSRIHQLSKERSTEDPVWTVGTDLRKEVSLLCLDEFQISDIADAAIISRLMRALWHNGVVTVATSNRAPSDLYTGGLNRHAYIPGLVKLMEQHCRVVGLDSGTDYRRLHAGHGKQSVTSSTTHTLPKAFELHSGVALTASTATKLKVMMGRELVVPRQAAGVAYFSFDQLCGEAVGAADYLALVKHYHTIVLEDVPLLGRREPDLTRRFISLVDLMYDHQRLLVCSASTSVQGLFPELSAQKHRGSEARLVQNAGFTPETAEIRVSSDGGSSGRLTTMVGDAEWSATGLKGASLAELSAMGDLEFCCARTVSRLVEMGGTRYQEEVSKAKATNC
eukprot:TRINITY_DN2487_c0_g1_i1.p1 TRINITY_DN2487_c0_g1~~TRINITY_DN2487_c0_g1_i1.p1  ORF type:complete len:423 (+),score=76.12 TRINITY_DN2487_c0_g1_i1:231-1499(+)